jgi:predicted acetylornithine/succinylornithine family transaminase
MQSTLNSQDIMDLERRYLAPTYKRAPLVLERGQGVEVWNLEGRRYLDFIAGIAVNPLGHCPPVVTQALNEQGARLMHVSNLFHSVPHALLARDLCESSFADRVFFCNSGTEASEGALKFARKVTGRSDFISFSGSFHGRTVGALSLTSNEKYRVPFGPLMPGVHFTPFNDLEAAGTLFNDKVAAVVVEPVQGEGGIFAAAPGFLQGLRQLCDEHGCLLIFDEVQCGLGRTGRLFAYEHEDVTPDLLTLAKPLGSGLPIGAILMTQRVADHLSPGDHGSTFAGSPLVCAVAHRVFQELSKPSLLLHVKRMGSVFEKGLQSLAERHPRILQVRGRGLMWGLGLQEDLSALRVVEVAAQHGLLVASAGANSVRFLPPLIVEEGHIEEALEILERVFQEIANS